MTELEEKENQINQLETELFPLYAEARRLGGERWKIGDTIKKKVGEIADLKKQISEMGGRNRKL